jgi:hypothetical protein
MREGTATVDVGNQHDPSARRHRRPHVGEISSAKVDLGGTARAFDQHKLVLDQQSCQRLGNRLP